MDGCDETRLKIQSFFSAALSDIGNTTLDSRLRPSAYDSYSPHHNSTLAATGHHMGTAASSKLLSWSEFISTGIG